MRGVQATTQTRSERALRLPPIAAWSRKKASGQRVPAVLVATPPNAKGRPEERPFGKRDSFGVLLPLVPEDGHPHCAIPDARSPWSMRGPSNTSGITELPGTTEPGLRPAWRGGGSEEEVQGQDPSGRNCVGAEVEDHRDLVGPDRLRLTDVAGNPRGP